MQLSEAMRDRSAMRTQLAQVRARQLCGCEADKPVAPVLLLAMPATNVRGGAIFCHPWLPRRRTLELAQFCEVCSLTPLLP